MNYEYSTLCLKAIKKIKYCWNKDGDLINALQVCVSISRDQPLFSCFFILFFFLINPPDLSVTK